MLLHTTNGDFILLAPRYSLAISTPIYGWIDTVESELNRAAVQLGLE